MTQANPTTALAAFTGFPDEWTPSSTAATLAGWNSITGAMGQAPTMMLTYIDLTHPLSEWVTADTAWEIASFKLGPWLPGEVTPIIGVPLALQGDNADTDFKAIAAGQWDQTLDGVFQAWANAGYKSIDIRPGHEMNGNWYPWSVTSANVADYDAAFQHVASLAHSFSGLSIKVVWSPNAVTYTTLPVSSYYPGNASVDIIGIDEYGPPLGTDTLPNAVATGPADYTLSTALAMAKADGKPFALAETSAMDTGFPANLASVVAASGVPVAYVALWDYTDPTDGNFVWSGTPTIAAAWKQAFATMSNSSSASGAPAPTTSANDSVVLPGSAAAITDATGNKWTISAGAQVAVNGVVDPSTSSTTELAYVNGSVWQNEGNSLWWSKTSSTATWKLQTSVSPLPGSTAPVTVGNGSDTLVVNISEDAWANGDGTSDPNGDAAFTISIDGTQLAGTFFATALHTAGASQNFTLKGNWAPGTHAVTVNFLDDAYGGTGSTDRDLYVNDITYNGTDTKQTATLWGWEAQPTAEAQNFSVTDTTSVPPAVIGSGSDSLLLKMSEDYYLANAQFTVSVDNKQLGGTLTATTLHSSGNSQTFAFAGDFGSGTHAVSVAFLNDAYGGSASTDRNLHVNDVVYKGTDTGQSVAIDSNGAKTLSVSGGTTPSVSETSDHGSLQENLSQVGKYTVGADNFVLSSGNAVSLALGTGVSQLRFIGASSIAVTGGAGQASLVADAGNNTFVAGVGSLDVTGGGGRDAYDFHATSGMLTIEDFSASKGDTLTIDKSLQASLHQGSDGKGGTMLTFGTTMCHGIDMHGVAAMPSANIIWA